MKKKQIDKVKTPKEKKDNKKYSIKKLPKLFKKAYTQKKFEKKLLKKIYVPEDEKDLRSLFKKGVIEKYPEKLAVPRNLKFTKREIRDYKWLAKEIKHNSKGRFLIMPFLALIGSISVLVVIIGLFKNPILKKVFISVGESISGAATDIGSVDLQIMKASLTVNKISVGNKNDYMKNIFETDKIIVDFNLTQALRGKIIAQDIEVAGIKVNTDRQTSAELSQSKQKKIEKKQKKLEKSDSQFTKSLESKKADATEIIQTQVVDLLGGTDVDSIVKNLESQLKTPQKVQESKDTVNALTEKWKNKPEEISKQVNDFNESVAKIQKLDVSKIQDLATLKTTLNQLNDLITKSKEVSDNVTKIKTEIQSDNDKIKSISTTLTNAINEDKKLAESKLSTASNATENIKLLFSNALESVGYSILGKYYPYAKKAIDYGLKMKATSSKNTDKKDNAKETKKLGSLRLSGTTFWYAQEYPSLLIEHVNASGIGFNAEVNNFSTDQDLRGKPMTAKINMNIKGINHFADIVFDTRTTSKADLLTLNYTGSGFTTKIDGSKIATKSGIPSVDGRTSINMKMTGGENGISASGIVGINPVTLISDGFDNEITSKYYNQALASVKNFNVGFKTSYSEKNGINLALTGDYMTQFTNAMKSILTNIGSDAKVMALNKVNGQINDSSAGLIKQVKDFTGINEKINIQDKKASDINNMLEAKKEEIETKIKNFATDSLKSKVNVPSIDKDTVSNNLKGKLGF